jgi:hypothetical protein
MKMPTTTTTTTTTTTKQSLEPVELRWRLKMQIQISTFSGTLKLDSLDPHLLKLDSLDPVPTKTGSSESSIY